MKIGYLLVVLILIICSVNSLKEYELTQEPDGFVVFIKSVKVISHYRESPFLFVGLGNTTFTSTEGNVQVDDYVHSKIPLSSFKITDHSDEDDTKIVFSNGDYAKIEVILKSSSQHDLEILFSDLPACCNRLWVRLDSDSKEHVYGAGEQFSYFDLKGRKFPIWTREQGIGRDRKSLVKFLADQMLGGYGGDYHTTYFPLPTFTSSRYYYCHVDSSRYMELDFSQADFHEIMVLGSPDRLYLSVADSMAGVLQRLSDFVGTQPLLPEWLSNGVIIGIQGGTEKMLETLKVVREYKVSVAGFWIQDWAGKIVTSFGQRVFWNWQWNQQRYPDLDKEIKRLHDEENIRVLAYITPHMNIDGDLFKSVQKKDYFMKNKQGDIYLMDFGEFTCATVDFTVAEAKEWYKGVIQQNLIDFGFGGWMADFSEYIPVDAVFSNGETGATMHSRFPALWAQVNREAVEERGKLGDVMFYMRAGSHGSQRYSTLSWAGDQNVDFSYTDGLATTIPAALSLGMSGMGLTHFDIGGYTTLVRHGSTENVAVQLNMIRTEELFLRGAEMAMFTPVMRTHEGNAPDINFQIYKHAESMHRFAKLVDMFMVLAPYTRKLIEENANTGLPLQRPLFIHYENDETTWEIMYHYMYGSELLIAPVLQPGQSTWHVYLPRGDDWVHLFHGTVYKGGQSVTVLAQIGTPPVFYREGSEWTKLFKQVADATRNPHLRKTEL